MTDKQGKKTVVIDARSKDDIIRDLQKANAVLQKKIIDMRAEHREQWDRLCPQLPDEMRARSRMVWEAALHAHETATAGQPGPGAVIAAALLDAEREGPRKLKGGDIDPVAFVAGRIESIAKANGRDPMELWAQIQRRMDADGDATPPANDPGEAEGEDDEEEADQP